MKRTTKKKKSTIKVKRLPSKNKWPFGLIQAIINDFKASMPEDVNKQQHLRTALAQAEQAVRERSVQKYVALCDALALNAKVNQVWTSETSAEDLEEIRKLRLLTIFEKYDFDDSPFDKELTAEINFLLFEALCQSTNAKKIWNILDDDVHEDDYSSHEWLYIYPFMRDMRRFIHAVLGQCDPLDFLFEGVRHGPGASTDKSGVRSIPLLKYARPLGVTLGAAVIFDTILRGDERWVRALNDEAEACYQDYDGGIDANCPSTGFTHLRIMDYSKITFVAKNAKTLRTINIEPSANVYLQLGVDALIRSRLKHFGYDLDTQEKNQMLAKQASKTGELATLDLSGASDSIAKAWLKLFPEKWAFLLNAIRCPKGRLKKSILTFEKLSSMGNGYTFVLETLIFAAILFAVHKQLKIPFDKDKVAIYGDDIICPVEIVDTYRYWLHRLGFKLNSEKSFWTGRVRESCGTDYINGFLISRFTIKEKPKYNWQLFHVHNSLFNCEQEYGIQLERAKAYSLQYATDVFYVPQSEDTIGGVFSVLPHGKVIYDADYQRLCYKVKQYVVGRRKFPKKLSNKRYWRMLLDSYTPMMFLNQASRALPPPLPFGRETLEGLLKRLVLEEPSHTDFLCFKNIYSIRTQMTFVASNFWTMPV